MKFSSIFLRGGLFGASLLGMPNIFNLMGNSPPTSPVSSFRKRGRSHKKMMKNPPNRTGWFQRHADISPMVITERMLMRHGWWRRKVRKEGVAIGSRKNEVVLK